MIGKGSSRDPAPRIGPGNVSGYVLVNCRPDTLLVRTYYMQGKGPEQKHFGTTHSISMAYRSTRILMFRKNT